MNTTGNRIRELRIRNKLTLDEVARHLGVGRQAIYKYEQGTVTNIPLENLEIMAELFHTTPGYLAGWTDDEKDNGRRLPVFIPDNETFLKIANAMTPTDYETVMAIFEKTYKRMKERGEIE